MESSLSLGEKKAYNYEYFFEQLRLRKVGRGESQRNGKMRANVLDFSVEGVSALSLSLSATIVAIR